VLINKSHALTGMLLLASCSAVSIAPAIAETTQILDNHSSSEMLVSQLLGHDTYEGSSGEQMNMADYKLGTVRGRAGTLLSIEVKDGDSIILEGAANPGDDVILTEEDGDYELVGQAHPYWITMLEEDYKYKMSAETKGTALSERTASLWARLKENEGGTVALPEQESSMGRQYSETVPEPQAEPVRGMW
jgi:hypothetical protein